MSQFQRLCFGLSLLVVAHSDGVQSNGPNACPHPALVTYSRQVYKSKLVPYQQHTFWRGWQTKYRTQYGWENEVAYRMETKYSCCAGYEGSVDNCTPVCISDCPANSFCAAPDQCNCREGYGEADCQPLCPEGCGKNEVCESPNQCSCQVGYERNAPGDSCVPVCAAGCGNHSFCAGPGTCECLPGYAMPEGGSACEPVCEPACGPNTRCQEPNVCVCVEGYQAVAQAQCSPICQTPCGSHSQCVRPGVCECKVGYSSEDSGCQPVCSSCPEHGSCLRPDVCICDPGYVMKGDRCEPRCAQECSDYARCVAPNVCECYPGYEPAGDDQKCQPKCSKGCPNGFCFSPEKCVCLIGHLMGPDDSCEPQCSLSCVHGKCTQPETCSCDPGYRFKDSSQHICEAVCERGCRNGDCVAPDICLCHVGYQPEGNSSVTSLCQPVCQAACVNGTCSAPDQCSCLPGYTKSSDTTCQPHCSKGCGFGDCVAPDECRCWPEYEETSEGCQLQTTSTSETYSDSTTSTPVVYVSSSQSSADLLQLPHWNCTGDCLCWVEFDEEGTLNTAKCAKVCLDDQDKPCLNMGHCRCDLPSGQLTCSDDGDEDYSSEETRYVCKVPKPKDPRAQARAEDSDLIKTSKSAPKWLILMGWCAGIVVIVAIAVAATNIYRKSSSRRNDEITETIYENNL